MYTGDGFHSIWHNWMVKALDKELLSERFQERDIRKNTASEVELEHTQLLLGTVRSTVVCVTRSGRPARRRSP